MPRNVERDAEIVRQFTAGQSLRMIAQTFHISHERVRKILQARGILTKRGQALAPESRDEFLGVNLSKIDKFDLREEAERRGVSMSALSADAIRKMLDKIRRERDHEVGIHSGTVSSIE